MRDDAVKTAAHADGSSHKSLAAEIEAVLIKRVKVVRIRGQRVRFIEDIPALAAEIAALQSRAFEDGARKGLADALAVYDTAESKRATASAVYDEVSSRMGGYPDIGEIMGRVGAEEACMRASLAADLARSKLIGTLRAALHPTPTTEDKGREE